MAGIHAKFKAKEFGFRLTKDGGVLWIKKTSGEELYIEIPEEKLTDLQNVINACHPPKKP